MKSGSVVSPTSSYGPPGIGKTRLSIQSGQTTLPNFRDGVWFVDLSGVEQADFLMPTIARALDTCDLPPCPVMPQLVSHLKNKNLLLVLDNFEQIAEDAAVEVAQILQRCPGVKALITSRVPLRIYGEHEYALPPLSIPPAEAAEHPARLVQYEAVQLFTARVRQHTHEFTITSQNAAALIKVCSAIDGIPLALELAAATLQHMPLDDMTAMLQGEAGRGWVRRLATPARDLPARQRTLENVIAWSHSLLDGNQQHFFNSLGVLNGWFDAEAAAAVYPASDQVASPPYRDWLDHLNDHSLLVRGNFSGKPYWRMLEIIHEFAAFQLTPQKRAELERLRCHFFLGQLQAASQPYFEALFHLHSDNFHAALRWAIAAQKSELAFQLAHGLLGWWDAAGYLREGLALIRQVLELTGEVNPALRVRVISESADLAWHQHDFDTALQFSEMAVQQAHQAGLDDLYPEYCNRLGRIYLEQGMYAEAAEALRESLALLPEPGRPLAQIGELAWFESRLPEAQNTLEQALAHLPEQDRIFQAMALTDLAEVALAQDDYTQCRARLQQASLPAAVNIRRTLVFLSALAGYLLHNPASTLAEYRLAAQVHGAIEGLSERSGVVLAVFY